MLRPSTTIQMVSRTSVAYRAGTPIIKECRTLPIWYVGKYEVAASGVSVGLFLSYPCGTEGVHDVTRLASLFR